MKKIIRHLKRIWSEDEGVLSFEWVLLVTLLTIGIVGGIAAARDAIIDELGDVAEAAMSIDQSFEMPADVDLGIPDIVFVDDGYVYDDCERGGPTNEQDAGVDDD